MSARANSDRRKRAMRVSRMFARRARQPFKIAVKVDVVHFDEIPTIERIEPRLDLRAQHLEFSAYLLAAAAGARAARHARPRLRSDTRLPSRPFQRRRPARQSSRCYESASSAFPASGYRLPDLAKFAKSMVCLPRARENNSARSSKSRRQIGRGRRSPHSRSDCIGSPASASPPTTLSKYNMRGPAYGAKKGQRHQEHL